MTRHVDVGRPEVIFAVHLFYDRPRKGVANFMGSPHAFDCIFDEAEDEYSELYRLKPISPEILALVMEDLSIYQRWQAAYARGKAKIDAESDTVLPLDRSRHVEIRRVIGPELEVPITSNIVARASFPGGVSVSRGGKVIWHRV